MVPTLLVFFRQLSGKKKSNVKPVELQREDNGSKPQVNHGSSWENTIRVSDSQLVSRDPKVSHEYVKGWSRTAGNTQKNFRKLHGLKLNYFNVKASV